MCLRMSHTHAVDVSKVLDFVVSTVQSKMTASIDRNNSAGLISQRLFRLYKKRIMP